MSETTPYQLNIATSNFSCQRSSCQDANFRDVSCAKALSPKIRRNSLTMKIDYAKVFRRVDKIRSDVLEQVEKLNKEKKVNFNFDLAIKDTKQRLEEGVDTDTQQRLTNRIAHLMQIQHAVQSKGLVVLGVLGWGDACIDYKQQDGIGLSEYDTFFLTDSDGKDLFAVQLDSTYQSQKYELDASLDNKKEVERSEDVWPLPTKLQQIISDFSRVHVETPYGEKKFFSKKCQYRQVVTAEHERLASKVAMPEPEATNLGIDEFLETVEGYGLELVRNQQECPMPEKWLNNLHRELHEAQKKGKFSENKSYRSGKTQNGTYVPNIDFNKDALPMARYFAAESVREKKIRIEIFNRSDVGVKLFFPIFNALSNEGFIKFNTGIKSIDDETVLSHELASKILDKFQTLSLKKTGEGSFQKVICQSIMEAATESGLDETEVMTAYLYQAGMFRKVSDKMGICCPVCTDGDEPTHQDQSTVVSFPVQLATLTMAIKPLNFEFDEGFHYLEEQGAQGAQGVLTSCIGAMKELGVLTEMEQSQAQENLGLYFERFKRYKATETNKLTMLMDYVLQLVRICESHDKKDIVLSEVKKTLLKLVHKLLIGCPAQGTHDQRFLAANVALTALQKVKAESQEIGGSEIDELVAKFTVNLEKENDIAYVKQYSLAGKDGNKDIEAPKEVPQQISGDFKDNFIRALKPIDVVLFTGFLGSGKTTYLSQLLPKSGNDIELDRKQKKFGVISNDAAGSFDTGMLSKDDVKENELLIVASKEKYDELVKKFGLEIIESAKSSQSGYMVELQGCICCKDRDTFSTKIGEINDALIEGTADIDALFIEATGIADAKGIRNAAFHSHGRIFWMDFVNMIDPSDENWRKYFDEDGKMQDFQGDSKRQAIAEIFRDQLECVNRYVINTREGVTKASIDHIKKVIAHVKSSEGKKKDQDYSIEEKDCEQDESRLKKLAHMGGVDMCQIEADDGESETVKAGIKAGYFKIQNPEDFKYQEFQRYLEQHNSGLIRLKGSVPSGSGEQKQVHVAGGKFYE
eukprot:COSAG01_NODE_547_length_15635_cov_102.896498_2_plen_1033_part_00